MKLVLPDNLHGLSKAEVQSLYSHALEYMEKAYAPYSNFKVGAAILTSGGSIVCGNNIENGSFGATICAERVAVVKAVSEGLSSFKAILIVANSENPIPPCGMCRQVISEFDGERIVVMTNAKGLCTFIPFDELFPFPFNL